MAHLFLEADEIDQAKDFFDKQEHLRAYKKNDLPLSFHLNHPSRTGDLVITTEAPNMFSSFGQPKGMHGYRPETSNMWGIFYALGAAVTPKKIGPIHQVDVAPTIANILGIEMPDDIQGKAVILGK